MVNDTAAALAPVNVIANDLLVALTNARAFDLDLACASAASALLDAINLDIANDALAI